MEKLRPIHSSSIYWIPTACRYLFCLALHKICYLLKKVTWRIANASEYVLYELLNVIKLNLLSTILVLLLICIEKLKINIFLMHLATLCGFQDLRSLTRGWTCVSCIGRQILNHWTTRIAPWVIFLRITLIGFAN